MFSHARCRPFQLVVLWLVSCPGCVAYDAAELDLDTLAASAAPPAPSEPLPFGAAVRIALVHSAELRRLEAEARAAGADLAPVDAQLQWEGDDDMLALMVDPVALLGLGQRATATAAAQARAAAAVHALAVARWRIVGQVAEVFASADALTTLTPPSFGEDPEPFVRAGLASPAAAAAVRAAAAAADAELAERAAAASALRAELCTLLGMPPVALRLAPANDALPRDPVVDEAALRARPDLSLAIAEYHVADAEFRAAVAEQYPALMLGPDVPLRAGAPDVMALLRLPLGGAARATAARERRTAARARVVGALVASANEAHDALAQYDAATRRAAASRAAAAASATALAAATAALAVEPDAFERLAERATMAMRDATEQRVTAVAAARLRIRAAAAWGWPAQGGRP